MRDNSLKRCRIFWLVIWGNARTNKPIYIHIWIEMKRQTPIHNHDDVIKWKHFPRYWSFVRGIHRSPVNSLHKGQWRRALMFSLIHAWTNGWANHRGAGDLRRYSAHYDVTVMRQRGPFIECDLAKHVCVNEQGHHWPENFGDKLLCWLPHVLSITMPS